MIFLEFTFFSLFISGTLFPAGCLPWGVARLLFPDRIPDQKPGIRVSAKKHKKEFCADMQPTRFGTFRLALPLCPRVSATTSQSCQYSELSNTLAITPYFSKNANGPW